MRTNEVTQGKIPAAFDRRSFMRVSGSVVLVGALGTSLLAGCATSAATWSGTINMLAWDFKPDVIKKLVSDWSDGNAGVDVAVIPNVGYSAAIQTRLRGGDDIDLYYNFAYNSQKFVDEGWATRLNGLPGVDDLVADLFESARERHVNQDGDIISVPYFSAVHMLHYNERMLNEVGILAPPETLKETYDQSKKLKDAGVVDSPYVAYWAKEFVEEYLHTYLLNEGITAFDNSGAPVFADDPKSEGVFEWWQTMYQEGLAAKSVISDDPGKLSNEMAQGNAAFFVLHHYFLSSIRDLAGPESDNVMQAAIGGTNHTLQIGEVLQLGVTETDEAREAAWELMKYYGWKDTAGRFAVSTEWAKAAGLAAPYPGFFTDPAVIDAFPDYYDLPLISDTFETGSKVVPARLLPWYPEFQAKTGDIIHALLLGQTTPKQTVTALADAVLDAKAGGTL